MPHRTTLLLCLVLPPVATAQTLAEQIAAAVPGEDWSEQFRKLGLYQQSLANLVDALVPLRGRLRGHLWVRATSLVTQRPGEIEDLWRAEPAKRRARAAVFADVMQGWAWLYQQASSPEERAGIEEVARFLAPFRHHTDQQSLPETHAAWLAAATRLQRIAVAAIHAGPNPYPEQLRRTDREGYDQLSILQGNDPACSPFHLAAVLVDPDLRVRARAAVALRRLLQIDPTPWLATALARDPALAVQQFAAPWIPRRGPLTDAEAGELITLLDKDDLAQPLARLDDNYALGAGTRARLAKALVDAGVRTPADRDSRDAALTQPAPLAGSARATWCFARAAQLGPTQFQFVIALAAATTDEQVAARVVNALVSLGSVPTADVPGAAGPLLALLEHRDDAVARGASTLAGRLLGKHTEPALREKLGNLALAALTKDAAALAFGPPMVRGCGTGPHPLGAPATKEAAWVKVAAAVGEVRLLAPLIAELQRNLAAGARRNPHHEWFVQACIGDLAHLADAEQARQLHELLGAAAKAPVSWEDTGGLLVRDIVFGIYPAVPADLLPWYTTALADAGNASVFAMRLDRVLDLVPEDRARTALAAADVRHLEGSALWLRAPELLTARWNARGAARSEAVRMLGNAWPNHTARIVQLVVAGRLPREFAAAAVPYETPALPVLAQVLPRGDAEAEAWWAPLAGAILRAPAGAPDTDLRALRELAAAPVAQVARVAAHRAAALGPEGKAVARTTFARLVADADAKASAEALDLAVDAGIEVPGLAEVIARLRQSSEWSPRMVADAAALRFLGADAGACPSGYPADAIARAKIDVDVAILRRAFGTDAQRHLPRLLQDASTASLVSGLQLAKELPWWTETIEKCVTWRTSHDDPRVRLAAYEALHSRDADVWACAWLVHEAVFDPDPAVQEFARKLGR